MLPKLDSGIALFLMFAWVRREAKGADFCRRRLVGPVREMARHPPCVIDLARPECKPTADVLLECREVLALHCRSCGACDLSKEGP